jgi:hypothetical protein
MQQTHAPFLFQKVRKERLRMDQPQTLDTVINFRLARETKKIIEQAAAADHRKPGDLTRLLVIEGLERRGLLPDMRSNLTVKGGRK